MIDNSLDIWTNKGKKTNLDIKITLDSNQQRIYFSDNAGGIKKSNLMNVVAPGHTTNLDTSPTIGIFGVGTKRAVVALAQEVKIRTRSTNETFQVEFDDDWIKQSDDWNLPVYSVDNIMKGSTEIELVKLRRQLTDDSVSSLYKHLGAVYSIFLRKRKITIRLNEQLIQPVEFENWAYPPGFEPRQYSGVVKTSNNKTVKVKAIAGLIMESSPAGGDYGVYFYCNDRLIAKNLKTHDVGFGSGLAGKPHADISLARIIIFINGEARLMPWNSSKSDIDTSHEVFMAIQNWLLKVVKDFTSLSRRLSKYEGGWHKNVFEHAIGNVQKVKVTDFPSANTSYLPPLPETRPRFSSVVQQNNRMVSTDKPWTIGLYEGIIAVDWITKQNLNQKNRLALILLDSTLEIAFKEFLVNDSGQQYSEVRLQNIFSDRSQVHNEVKKLTTITDRDWKKIMYYYLMRCQLIHKRASVSISDDEVRGLRSIVERVLKKLFRLEFPN